MARFFAGPGTLGAADGSTPGDCYQVKSFLSSVTQCVPGNELELADGTYINANGGMIQPVYGGTVGAPIKIYAKNDGAVTIDGEGSHVPVLTNTNAQSYYNLVGINACHSNSDVFSLNNSDGWLIQRVCGWDAANMNNLIFAQNYGVGNTIEDFAGWGIARKICLSYSTPGPNYWRRGWTKFQRSEVIGPKQSSSLAYHSYNIFFENILSTWDQAAMPGTYTLRLNANPAVVPTDTACNFGADSAVDVSSHCIMSNKLLESAYGTMCADANTAFPWSAGITYAINAVKSDGANIYKSILANNIGHQPSISPTWWALIGPTSEAHSKFLGCIAYTKVGYVARQPQRLILITAIDEVELRDSVAYYPTDASFDSTKQPAIIANGITQSGLNAVNFTTFRGLTAPTSWGTSWVKTNVKEALTPAALYVGVGESLYNTSQGAQIRYQYVNGALTPNELWPWPMNQRIKDATLASGYVQEDVDATMQAMFGTYPTLAAPPPPPPRGGGRFPIRSRLGIRQGR